MKLRNSNHVVYDKEFGVIYVRKINSRNSYISLLCYINNILCNGNLDAITEFNDIHVMDSCFLNSMARSRSVVVKSAFNGNTSLLSENESSMVSLYYNLLSRLYKFRYDNRQMKIKSSDLEIRYVVGNYTFEVLYLTMRCLRISTSVLKKDNNKYNVRSYNFIKNSIYYNCANGNGNCELIVGATIEDFMKHERVYPDSRNVHSKTNKYVFDFFFGKNGYVNYELMNYTKGSVINHLNNVLKGDIPQIICVLQTVYNYNDSLVYYNFFDNVVLMLIFLCLVKTLVYDVWTSKNNKHLLSVRIDKIKMIYDICNSVLKKIFCGCRVEDREYFFNVAIYEREKGNFSDREFEEQNKAYAKFVRNIVRISNLLDVDNNNNFELRKILCEEFITNIDISCDDIIDYLKKTYGIDCNDPRTIDTNNIVINTVSRMKSIYLFPYNTRDIYEGDYDDDDYEYEYDDRQIDYQEEMSKYDYDYYKKYGADALVSYIVFGQCEDFFISNVKKNVLYHQLYFGLGAHKSLLYVNDLKQCHVISKNNKKHILKHIVVVNCLHAFVINIVGDKWQVYDYDIFEYGTRNPRRHMIYEKYLVDPNEYNKHQLMECMTYLTYTVEK